MNNLLRRNVVTRIARPISSTFSSSSTSLPAISTSSSNMLINNHGQQHLNNMSITNNNDHNSSGIWIWKRWIWSTSRVNRWEWWAAGWAAPNPFMWPDKAIMTVTPAAAERVLELLKLDESWQGIKVWLRKRGCSGMSYEMDFLKEAPDKFDEIITWRTPEGVEATVVVDSAAVLFLVGTEMDYVEVEMGSEFVFRNPNEKGQCGCGQSFNV